MEHPAENPHLCFIENELDPLLIPIYRNVATSNGCFYWYTPTYRNVAKDNSDISCVISLVLDCFDIQCLSTMMTQPLIVLLLVALSCSLKPDEFERSARQTATTVRNGKSVCMTKNEKSLGNFGVL